ncbi:MAG TPA: hypothetical protein VKX49_04405 [Bryobacteraceae bacterium]|nr:hypothetical protein [Bryobacteraceae bacterium]
MTVTNATVSFGLNITVSGPATLTNIGSGTFSATGSASSLGSGGQNLTVPFTIALSNGTDSIKGNISLPLSAISGQSGTGSATITDGTGAYAGATGSFPTLNITASGSVPNLTISLTGSGTVVTGGPPAQVPPSITQVLNNYSLIPAGFVNSGIAQGALFIIKGSGLADPNAKALPLQDSTKGLPTTLNGASVKVTVNGTTTVPVFYYAIASQLALVMPSNTPVGNGQVTVTFNGQSASFPIQVVQSAMGFDAYYGAGTGLGVATDNNTGALYNYTNSIPPGTAVVLWGSGLGADPARDNTFAAAAFQINGLAHVYIGGVDAPIIYQGASGYPGVNQVNVIVPANAPTGCNVSLVGVTAAGIPTNFLSIPVGTGVCKDPFFGIDGTLYQTLSAQTTVKSGFVGLSHDVAPANNGSGTQVTDVAIASFQQQSGSAYASGGGSISIPGCTVIETLGAGGGNVTTTGLDPGTISVTSPTGANATLQGIPQVQGTFFSQLPSGFIPTTGGTFPFHGSGGKDVGSFDTSVVFPNPLLTWTNKADDASVTRSSGVLFTWSGGADGTLVIMTGSSSGTINGQPASGSFTCIAPQSALRFMVPNYVTNVLPVGNGQLSISNYTQYKTFTASGIDIGTAVGFNSESTNTTVK